MNMGMDNVIYWLKNQAAIVYVSRDLSPSAPPLDIATKVTSFRKQLNEQVLNVQDFKLVPLKTSNVQQQVDVNTASEVDDLHGVYLFSPAESTTAGVANPTTVVVFYHIEPNPDKMTGAMPGAGSMDRNGGANGMGMNDATDHTLTVVDQLNMHKDALRSLNVLTFDALPHWLGAGTPDGTHGCPVTPPIPAQHPRTSGGWKTTLRLANSSLQDKTGEGVTVFVLDTLPTQQQIFEAAKTAGHQNMLLQDMIEQIKLGHIKLFHQAVPDPEDSAVTGKDIYGRLASFPLVDHGLFIAGIIHDLAPKTALECIRVLNDFGVGTFETLTIALQHINNRMSKVNPETRHPGDLYRKTVVINLSLVIGPPESDLPRLRLDNDPANPYLKVKPYLQGLNLLLQNLVEAGAVFAAAASNDSDPRDSSMNPAEVRFGPRYPAAFLYDDPSVKSMIPVGAINRHGKAASYSNHPGPEGIGAYGGELPKPKPWLPSAMSHVITDVDTSEQMDAFRGVYCYPFFPALSMNDQYPQAEPSTGAYPMSTKHNVSAWAYWSGTSFATPVITALAARSLQGFKGSPETIPAHVHQAIIAVAHKTERLWTSTEDDKAGRKDLDGYAVMVKQE